MQSKIKKSSDKFQNFGLYGANWMIYSLTALYYPFIGVYLTKESTGFDEFLLGILFAVGPLVSVVAPLFWGRMSDKARHKNSVIIIIVLLSVIFYSMIAVSMNFIWLLVMLMAVMFCISPFGGLVDNITLEYTTKKDRNYGVFRVMGTFGFGVTAVLCMNYAEQYKYFVFVLYAICAVVCSVFIYIMPKIKGYDSHFNRDDKSQNENINTEEKVSELSFLSLLKDKNVVIMLILVGVGQFSFGFYFNFFPNYFINDLNQPGWLWGVSVLLNAWGEIPFFFYFKKIMDKLGIKTVAVIASVVCVFRYVCFAYFTNVWLLLITCFVTGLMPTILVYCLSKYLNDTIPKEKRAVGQSMVYGLGNGISKVLAGLLGGALMGLFGMKVSLLFCSALTLVTLIPLMKIKIDSKKASY